MGTLAYHEVSANLGLVQEGKVIGVIRYKHTRKFSGSEVNYATEIKAGIRDLQIGNKEVWLEAEGIHPETHFEDKVIEGGSLKGKVKVVHEDGKVDVIELNGKEVKEIVEIALWGENEEFLEVLRQKTGTRGMAKVGRLGEASAMFLYRWFNGIAMDVKLLNGKVEPVKVELGKISLYKEEDNERKEVFLNGVFMYDKEKGMWKVDVLSANTNKKIHGSGWGLLKEESYILANFRAFNYLLRSLKERDLGLAVKAYEELLRTPVVRTDDWYTYRLEGKRNGKVITIFVENYFGDLLWKVSYDRGKKEVASSNDEIGKKLDVMMQDVEVEKSPEVVDKVLELAESIIRKGKNLRR